MTGTDALSPMLPGQWRFCEKGSRSAAKVGLLLCCPIKWSSVRMPGGWLDGWGKRSKHLSWLRSYAPFYLKQYREKKFPPRLTSRLPWRKRALIRQKRGRQRRQLTTKHSAIKTICHCACSMRNKTKQEKKTCAPAAGRTQINGRLKIEASLVKNY